MSVAPVVRLGYVNGADGPLDTGAWRIEMFEPWWGPACYRFWRRQWDGRWQPHGDWQWCPCALLGGP